MSTKRQALDWSGQQWHVLPMWRRWAIAGLLSVTALLLAVGLFEAPLEERYGDGGLIELLAAPIDETKPWGPLLWLAGLFAFLAPLRPWHRLAARIVAAVALLAALFRIALIADISGEVRWPTGDDAVATLVLLVIAAAAAWWGFEQPADDTSTAEEF